MNDDLKTTHRAPIVLLDESAMIYDPTYSLAIGHVRKGKSAFFEAEALRRGITYEELIEQLKPTPEQREQYQLAQKEKNPLEQQRLMAVREAFWQNTPMEHEDLSYLHDVVVALDIVEDPTAEHIKALFLMLPADIIGSVLSWGLSDTEVRESIFEFVKQNEQAVLKAVRLG